MTSIQEYILLFNIGLSLLMGRLSLKRSNISGATNLAVLCLVIALWSMTYLLYRWQVFPYSRVLFVSSTYLLSTIAAALLLIFSLNYSSHSKWVNRYTIGLLVVQPAITQLLFWIPQTRVWFFFGSGSSLAGIFSPHTGLWSHLHTIYLYNFEIVSVLLLAEIFLKKPRTLLLQSGTLLAGSFVPFAFRLSTVLSPQSALFDISTAGYAVGVIGLAYGIYRKSIIEISPITTDTVIEGMTDGWMILDLQNSILDINPAAEKILGITRQNAYGRSVRSVLPDWYDILSATEGGRELEMRRSIKAQEGWRYFDVRLSGLRDRNGDPFGQLIVWRDITERKIVEEARQRARDEMFVLLNSISSAASHAMNLDDFLSEAVYQIISPFESQVVVIFLADENQKDDEIPVFRLMAHYGLSEQTADRFHSVQISGPFLEEIYRNNQPVTITDARIDPRIPMVLRQDDAVSLLLLPLSVQTGNDCKILGAICLGRREVKPYNQDDIIRLTSIAEQIATLIDSERRRQLSIALSERERLLRDLHDSVSQKLYGLVTLTEAAQAALEAGSKVVPSQVLAKIGENARQAVKEMRLFLYEMQPVDLEEEGLVTVLHHRLAAVEGRADIQARLLADEDIALSKSKEVALYYIAQEALNNVLKHAHAQSVLVTLKQTRQNVILEVVDNGRGFDARKVERGGMGLQNMKARAAQINAKIKVTSTPGAGTTIKVKVSRDRSPIQAKNR